MLVILNQVYQKKKKYVLRQPCEYVLCIISLYAVGVCLDGNPLDMVLVGGGKLGL